MLVGTPLYGQTPRVQADSAPPLSRATPAAAEPVPADYVIGADDVLAIVFWRDKDMTSEVAVRPDGKISLPLLNDVQAAGLTPTELRDQITTRLAEYIPAPEVSVMVREVHSRKVAVVGAVKMPGRYEMKSPMTVLEEIGRASCRERVYVLV